MRLSHKQQNFSRLIIISWHIRFFKKYKISRSLINMEIYYLVLYSSLWYNKAEFIAKEYISKGRLSMDSLNTQTTYEQEIDLKDLMFAVLRKFVDSIANFLWLHYRYATNH